MWVRCTGPNTIAYVAAVPKNGYQRTEDVENPGGIVQVFRSSNHTSTISAECSGSKVQPDVEEEPSD